MQMGYLDAAIAVRTKTRISILYLLRDSPFISYDKHYRMHGSLTGSFTVRTDKHPSVVGKLS